MSRLLGACANAVTILAALALVGCGASRPPQPPPAPAAAGEAAAAARPIASIYPQAASVRMFIASDVHVMKPKEHDERRWLNPPDGFRLNPDQIAQLRGALVDAPVPNAGPACFMPHHFFRFYDKAGHQVGEVKVCFCCLAVNAEPGLVAGTDRVLGAHYREIAAIVTELGGSLATDCSADERLLLTGLAPKASRPPIVTSRNYRLTVSN